MTVDNSGLVTSFVGTASGFDTNPVFNGPVTLGQGPGGPNFVYIDDKFTPVANYFSAGRLLFRWRPQAGDCRSL
jgi:hypothetical protein